MNDRSPFDHHGRKRDDAQGDLARDPIAPRPPLPWTDDGQDPDGVALAEGWSALDQLIRGARLTEFDAAAQARLVRAVERRGRRRTLVGWGAAAAVAAGLLLMLAIRLDGPGEMAGAGGPSTEQPTSIPAVAPTATTPDRDLAATETDAPGLRAALGRTEAERTAAEFWSDEYDTDLQSTRRQALEVELSWRRGSEPINDLQQRFDELQADWNERAL